MKNLERSLCSTCVHVSSCSLTTNKNFIWSCSEYEHYETKKQQPKTLTKAFNFASREKEIECI